MKKIFLFLIILLMSFARKETNQDYKTINVVDAKEVNNQHVLIDYIKDIQVIPLEFTNNNPIGYVQQITIANDRIYVLDQSANKLHISDSNGSYINTLDKQGRGPEEYSQLKSFEVNNQGNILILTYKKIIKYDASLNYLSTTVFKETGDVRDFTQVDDKTILVNNYSDNNENNKLLSFLDSNGKIVESHIEIKHNDFGKKSVFKTNNYINILPPFYDNTIWSISKDLSIIDKYKILLPQNDKNQKQVLSNMQNEETKRLNYNINLFIETTKLCYVEYNGSPMKCAVFNKKTGECIKGSFSLTSKENGMLLNIRNVSLDGSYVIGVIPCDLLLKYCKDLKATNYLDEEQVKKIKNIDINGNPVIFKIYLK